MAAESQDLPAGLERGRHVELEGRHGIWTRRGLMVLLLAIPVIALLNVIGQAQSTTSASGPTATLSIRAPDRLRGGLIYETVFTIRAHRSISNLHLVLSPGWFDGLTLNTLEPSPGQEGSRDGRVSLSYGSLDPGKKLEVFAAWQVNPTTITHRDLTADVYDGGTLLVHGKHSLTILP